jgi:predicted RNase H-like HicB family nuclease
MSTAVEKPKYALLVEWSDEDHVYIGRCPELFGGGVHGADREKVFAELCQVVDEVIEDAEKTGVPLPPPGSSHAEE